MPDLKRELHSLDASSFPIKQDEVESERRSGLAFVKSGWLVFFGVILLAGFLHLCRLVYNSDFIPELKEALTRKDDTESSSAWAWIIVGILLFVILLGSIQYLGTEADVTFSAVGSAIDGSGWAPEAAMESDGFKNAEVPKKAAPRFPLENAVSAKPKPPARVRQWFPETLLWRPELVTDDQGRATLDLELADSITTWRLAASVVSGDGELGGAQESIRVFQPFFVDLDLPVALTRNDEVAVRVVVHNHVDRPQLVKLELSDAPWFELMDDAEKLVEVKPNDVQSVYYRIKVRKVGNHRFEVQADSDGVADAIRKDIEVVPDGRPVETVQSGNLDRPVTQKISVPGNAIEGSSKLLVKLYPSTFSQLLEGLDNIFQMPHGCFEQTSSTTYPNILALDYLRRTKQSVPQVEAKARQYIHIGYQRLVSFEVAGGGFDWYGRPPANVWLTAYGLMEFEDMARVYDVDPKLIERTRAWLLNKQNQNGTWDGGGRMLMEGRDYARYAPTAYVAWSVFRGKPDSTSAGASLFYLLKRKPDQFTSPYVLALTCNALLALDPNGGSADAYLDRLVSLRKTSGDGKQSWWELGANHRTAFYGAGRAGHVETTALAVLALLESKRDNATVRGALNWLIEQKDPHGTWYSTQATVLALKALVAGTGKQLAEPKDRIIELTLGDDVKRRVVVPADQAEVMQLIDLSSEVKDGQVLSIRETTGSGTGYQVVSRYHVPNGQPAKRQEPLAISIDYDRKSLPVNDTVQVTARVFNQTEQPAPMVILDLPVPAGFAVVPDDLANLVKKKQIAKFQVAARKIIVYLRQLQPRQPLTLRYRLRATNPVKVTVAPAKVYEYYDPAARGVSKAGQLTVTER